MAAWVESKLSGIGESIFSTMSRMAHECGAINLSQGFPEFQPHQALIEAVHKALLDGYNQYAPMPGLPLLREAIAGKCAANLGYILHPE
ncbi:MAG: methionine aminotransferase, partial [Bacteroidia bacterium]